MLSFGFGVSPISSLVGRFGAVLRFCGVAIAASVVLGGCGSPPRPACDPDPQPGQLGTLCGVENPEDIEIVLAAGIALVSEMRMPGLPGQGALAAFELDLPPAQRRVRRLWPLADMAEHGGSTEVVGDPGCDKPPAAEDFYPHGITAFPTSAGVVRVAVVGHGPREAVELFELDGAGAQARLTWRGCVPMPPGVAANDVVAAGDGSLVVSNFQPVIGGWEGVYHMSRAFFGVHTGDILHWQAGHGWRTVAGTGAANANGVLMSSDGTRVLYAETGTGSIHEVPLQGEGPRRTVVIGGSPDNLTRTEDGRVLVATHTQGLTFLSCALGRLPCRSGWEVYAVDPDSFEAELVLAHDGATVGAIATAVHHSGAYFLGSVFDDRIGLFPLP